MTNKNPEKDKYAIKAALEKTEEVQKFLEFISLPIAQQQKAFDEWEQYYRDVKKSNTYALYQEIRTAYKKGDKVRFHDLQRQMKQMREAGVIPELEKPSSIEPLALYNDQLIIKYRNTLQDIKRSV